MLINPWFGLLAPAGTPTDAINTLNTTFNQALNKAEVKDRLDKLGVNPAGGTPAELSAFLETESAAIGQLIKENGITANQ